MELRCGECLAGALRDEEDSARRQLERGWYIGDESFKDRMKHWLEKSIAGRKRESLTGEGRRDHEENAARRWIAVCLNHLGVPEAELKARKPGDLQKQMVTALVRKRSMVTYDWIIEELGMGSRPSVYKAIRHIEELRGREQRIWRTLSQLSI